MAPARPEDAATRDWRIDAWLHRKAPEGDAFPGDPRLWERLHGTTAALTPLGRKLLGLDVAGRDSGRQSRTLRCKRGTTTRSARLCAADRRRSCAIGLGARRQLKVGLVAGEKSLEFIDHK